MDAFGSEVEAAARGNAGIAAARARRHQRHADVVGREFGPMYRPKTASCTPRNATAFSGGRTRNTRRSSPPRRIEPLSQYPVVLRPSIDEPIFVDRGFAAVVGRNRQLQLGQAVDHTPPSQGTSMIAVPNRSCRPCHRCPACPSSSGYRNLTKDRDSVSPRGFGCARKRTTSQSRDVAVSGVIRSTSFSESASRRSGGGLESVMR